MTKSITEADVRDYFLKQARAFGWLARKVSWEGRSDAPDWVLMKAKNAHAPYRDGFTIWVELKRPGKKPTAAQRLEHEMMRRYGQDVHWLDSRVRVDEFFEGL